MEKIEIPLSETKLYLGIVGSILFVFLGLYLFTTLADRQTRYSPTYVKIAGISGVLFFGATCIYGIKKTFDKKIGLAIDANGINDNTYASSIGLIKWSEITEIKTVEVYGTKFLLIYTNNPHEILERAKGMKHKLMQGNMKIYGTPITITVTTLKCNFDELERLINDNLNKQN